MARIQRFSLDPNAAALKVEQNPNAILNLR